MGLKSSKRPSTTLGEFEFVVLLAVLGLKSESYPLSIRDAIEAKTKRVVSRAAVFITLERLEDKGYLSSYYGDPTPVRGGRAKRLFSPTSTGLAAARQSLNTVTAMTRGLEAILKQS
jgi:PadR family transcriptional regulator, regulatory protein PadR